VEFEIGTGMDDHTRAVLWRTPPIGKQVKFKFQPTGIKDKPRFPVYLGIRED
jgi:DNA ligase-1